MPSAIQGARGVGNADTDARGKHWMGIARLSEARENVLAVVSSVMTTETTSDIEYNWFERDIEPFEILSNGSANSSATSLIFKDESGGGVNFNLRKNSTLKNDRSKEIVIVELDPTSNTGAIPVTRNWGTNGAKEINDGDRWTILGPSDEENKPSPKAISLDPSRKTNFIQLMRESIELGVLSAGTEYRTGPEYARLRKDAFLAFLRKWERAWIHQQPKDAGGSSTDVRRTATGGMLQAISSNFKEFNGKVSETTWIREIGKGFRYGSRSKLAFCGMDSSLIVAQMAFFSGGQVYLLPGDTTYGLEINEYRAPVGRLSLLYTPALGISTNYSNIMIVVDSMQFKRVVFPNLDFKLLRDVQERGVLGIKDEFVMAAGLKLGLEKHHALWQGMTELQL